MCDHIVKLTREMTKFHVSGKLFKAGVNLQFVVQEQYVEDEEKVVKFSLYNLTPRLRVWGTTFRLCNNSTDHGRKIVYSRTWQCIDKKYFDGMKSFIYMCANFYDAK